MTQLLNTSGLSRLDNGLMTPIWKRGCIKGKSAGIFVVCWSFLHQLNGKPLAVNFNLFLSAYGHYTKDTRQHWPRALYHPGLHEGPCDHRG